MWVLVFFLADTPIWSRSLFSTSSECQGVVFTSLVQIFVSPVAYREDSRRVTRSGSRQTEQGSTGNAYERCALFASNNVFQNRRIISNLVHADRVSGDKNFVGARLFSDEGYAKRLGLFYGQNRI